MTEETKRRGRPRKYDNPEEARNAANLKWAQENKEHKKYLSYRTYSRSFIRKLATIEDLDELSELIEKRKSELSQN